MLPRLLIVFPSGVGECEVAPRYINPLNLRRPKAYTDALTGHDVDPEGETTDVVTPTTERPIDTGDGASVSGTKITKTTITKKVTNTTIKKTTTKTSSEKEYSSSSGSSSSSSTGYSSSSTSSSQSGYEGYGDNVEGSGYDDSSHVHGRTHSRVSRRVYTSSDRSRFKENEFEDDTAEGEEDKDGRANTQYERTHHSSGTSPDGKSTFKETRHESHSSGMSPDGTSTFKKTHHESRRVTVSEDTKTDHIPSSRWGQGGYRRTYTASSSSGRTSDSEPEETRVRLESHRTYSTGRDGDNQWGYSDPSDSYGRREESYRQQSKTHTYDSSSRGSHSGGLGEENYRRTHEGGAVTRTIGGEGSYYTESDRRTGTRIPGDTNDRGRFGWTDESERTPYSRDFDSRHKDRHYQENSHRKDDGSRSQDYSSHQGYDRHSSGQSYRSHLERHDERNIDGVRTYSSDQGRQSEGAHRGTSEGDRLGDRHYIRSEDDASKRDDYAWTHSSHDAGRDQDHWGRHGGYEESHSKSERQRSRSEARTSAWHSHSSSGHEGRGDFDDSDRDEAKTHQHFTHMESGDGTIQNGTYTRVEVDPKSGKTKTYTSKVVYNRWPTDHELSITQREHSSLPTEEQDLYSDYQRSRRTKREEELIIKPQAVTDEKTGKTMQVVHLVSNIQVLLVVV